MNREQLSRDSYFKIKDTLSRRSRSADAKDAINSYSKYFCNSGWIANAKFQEYSNGCYLGGTDNNGQRSDLGLYVFNDGDIYLGHWCSNVKDGEGFYYSNGDVTFGEWDRGKIIQNRYDDSGGRQMHSSSSSSKSNWITTVVVIIVVIVILRFIGCIDIG